MYYYFEISNGEKTKVRVSDQLLKDENLTPVDLSDLCLLGYIDAKGNFQEKEIYNGWTLLPSKFEGFEEGHNPIEILREMNMDKK